MIGMKEWQDVSVRVDFRLPARNVSACVGTRVDQMWVEGIVVCVYPPGEYYVTLGGPALNGFTEPHRRLLRGWKFQRRRDVGRHDRGDADFVVPMLAHALDAPLDGRP